LNCRRVNSLLSAYIDGELTGEEMLTVRAHLGYCPDCQMEHEALLQTKRLLTSLAMRTPRAELESLLVMEIEREARRPFRRWLPSFPIPAFFYQIADAWDEAVANTDMRVRPNTVLATVALSVVGLWMASATLDGDDSNPHLVGYPDTPVLGHMTGPVIMSGMPSASHNGPTAYSLEPPPLRVAYQTISDGQLLPEPVSLPTSPIRSEPMQSRFSVTFLIGKENRPRPSQPFNHPQWIVSPVLTPVHP
jgi:hypothetical protein